MIVLITTSISTVEKTVILREIRDGVGALGSREGQLRRFAFGHTYAIDIIDSGLIAGEKDLTLVLREGRSEDSSRIQELLDRILFGFLSLVPFATAGKGFVRKKGQERYCCNLDDGLKRSARHN